MAIKNELNKLKEMDIWSLMLFVLYNYQNTAEYSSISELAYILDKKNLLKLCEYFGGTVIKIPTIEELETTLYAMLLYNYIHREGHPQNVAISLLHIENKHKLNKVLECYETLSDVMKNYELTPRGRI